MQKYFFIRFNGRNVRINFSDVNYIEGSKNYIKIVTEQKTFLVLITMKRMEQLLPPDLFLRIHKSYIVAIEKINAFDADCAFLDNVHLPVGSQYKGVLERSVLVVHGDVGEKIAPVNYYTLQSVTA